MRHQVCYPTPILNEGQGIVFVRHFAPGQDGHCYLGVLKRHPASMALLGLEGHCEITICAKGSPVAVVKASFLLLSVGRSSVPGKCLW